MSNNLAGDKLCINIIRGLAMDGPQQARSGHPGAAMALAPLGWTMFSKIMKHDPQNPHWYNRDRFILSCGHASMLIYSLLHLSGYSLSLDDLKNFRQWGSLTPGHPEYGHTVGVEMTTGPLGQGLSSAVGFALAERYIASYFNRPNFEVMDHYTYVFCSDGDLMEGITSEAGSLAAALGLGKLIAVYDDNRITIEGSTDITFTEDRVARYAAYGWHVQSVADANDTEAFAAAVAEAQKDPRPSLISVRSHIAYPSPKMQDTSASHGTPFGDEEIAATKKVMGLPEHEKFYVPAEVYEVSSLIKAKGAREHTAWDELFAAYAKEYPELAAEFENWMEGRLPEGWDQDLITFEPDAKGLATRAASGKVINAIAARVPNLIGGSADLEPSTKTFIKGSPAQSPEHHEGRNIHFGIREHAMGAVVNGMMLHGGVQAYDATFLVFADYMRGSVRLGALMGLNAVHVWTHDSIGLGEDGPTHQPIEHLASLRIIPNFTLLRPCDANETAEAWKAALKHKNGPVGLALTRQNLPTLDRTKYAPAEGLHRGAYVLAEAEGAEPKVILMASGSEVHIALEAREKLQAEGIPVRVVSFPSWELFEAQSDEYRESVLPQKIKARLSIEAASTFGWSKYVGSEGASLGIDHFGASAPYEVLYEKFGLTADNAAACAKALLK
ncbi:MAG: transketolase [Candidatus Bruticola sp.]